MQVLIATIAVLVLAACGAAGPAGTATPPRLGEINAWGGDPSAEGSPRTGGTLRIGIDRDVSTFDPALQNTTLTSFAIYDSLMKIGPDGTAEPHLAESMSSADGGVTWRLGLRAGVRFSDGAPLDAAAVILNVQRHIDKIESGVHSVATRIVSMTAVDPLTVEFVLDGPLGSFPALFGQSPPRGSLGLIASPAAIAEHGDDIGRHPVGAGPFRLVEWIPGSHVTVERNPDYWQQGMPYLDEIRFVPLSDTDSRYASVQNGDVDMIFSVYAQELVRAVENPDLTVYYGPGNAGDLMYFNVSRPPFNDRRMREAVIRGINMEALSAGLYNNRLVESTSLFDVASPYHSEAASEIWPAADLERAKQLVDEYRAEGHETSTVLKSTNSRGQFGEFMQAQLAAIGITAEVQLYDLAQFSTEVVQGGDFDLTTTVYSLDDPFPGAHWLVETDGPANYGRYSNPEVDQLLATAASTPDQAARVDAYHQVERILNQDLAFGWISRSFAATIARNSIKGVDRYPTSRAMFFATLWRDDPS